MSLRSALRALTAIGVLALLGGADAQAAAPYFTVTDLGTLGGANSIANDINDAGQVVGAADLPNGSTHACFWNGGPIQDLGGLGGSSSEALRINIHGVAVGYAYNASGVQKPVRWTNGVIEDLAPGGGAGVANDINDSGQLAISPNTAISNSGIIASSTPDIRWSTEPSSWDAKDQPGAISAISDTGFMAVTYTFPQGASNDVGFIFTTDFHAYWSFTTQFRQATHAFDVNNAGVAVGQSTTGGGIWHAVQLSASGGGLIDLNNAIAPGQGWLLTNAKGINAAGQIVGQGTINGQSHAFLLTPAPPPPAASVQVNPSLDFGSTTAKGTSPAQTLTVTNSGNAALNISSVTLTGTNPGDFQVTGGTGVTVAAGASTDLSVTFKPQTIGSRSATLTITSNADNGPNTVTLTGSGTGAQVQVDSSRAFGTTIIEQSSPTQTVVVTNTGTQPLTISSVSFSGANPGDFQVTGGTGITVPVNGTTPLTVSFVPTASGNRSASLIITSDAFNSPNSVSLTGVGATPPPAAPTGLLAKAAGIKINLTWTDNSNNETAFEVYRQIGSGSISLIAVLAPNTVSFTDTGMQGSTTYTYKVRAANDYWASAFSNFAVVTTATPPAAPTGLAIVGYSYNKVSLAWTDNSTNETAFEIYRKTGSGAYALIGVVAPNTTSFQDTTVSPSTSYSYQVRAANDYWASAYASAVLVTTIQAPPAAPTGLAAQVVSASQINLTWTDNSNNETAFEVYRQTGTGGYTLAAVLPPGTTTFADRGMAAHTTYSYKVRAANDYWASTFTNVTSARTP